MRRPTAWVLILLVLASGCARSLEDIEKLRRILDRSELQSRTFRYEEVSAERAFTVDASILDDFRVSMILSNGGQPLIEQVIQDDAMAVRFVAPDVVAQTSQSFGHPEVDQALRQGRWVLDPSGAPPLVDPEATEGDEEDAGPESPFEVARNVLQRVQGAASIGREVREFTEEDIEYKPSQDPWRYPDDDEVRYDILRPRVPKSADELLGSQQGADAITEAHFRKISVFTEGRYAQVVCGIVDVRGHEDFVEAREKRNNPFLLDLMRAVLRGETRQPIRPREFYATFHYAGDVAVTLPEDAQLGKLDTFRTVMDEGLEGGVLAAPRDKGIDACDRSGAEGPQDIG